MPWVWSSGISGDKKKMWSKELRCPWDHPDCGCPSHRPFPDAHPPKMKLIERVQPNVYKFQCQYCHMVVLYGADDPGKVPESHNAVHMNPSLIGGQKGYLLT